MLFNSIFGRKNSTSSTSSKGVKLNKKNHQPRHVAFEPLESRDLLTVTTGLIDNAAYNEIRAAYPEFELPEVQADLNVMTITPDDGALSLADLKSAIETAGTTTLPDLILVQTSTDANSVTYAIAADELSINIDSTQYGSITILGWGEENFTLDANQLSRVMRIDGESTVANLGGLTIQNGIAENGGGLYINANAVAIANCNISDNTASFNGGGIYNDGSSSTLSITNSTISGNEAKGDSKSRGGGMYNNYGTITIANSTISGNATYYDGGGICNNDGITTITNSAISDNTAVSGGGIHNHGSDSTLIITNSTISANSSSANGGGIYNWKGTLTLTESEISENTSPASGGGIYNDNGTTTITSSAISGNSASSFGGGIYSFGTLIITDSTISNNTTTHCGGGLYSANFAEISHSIIDSNTARWGGGISMSYRLSISDCIIQNNNATSGGGGVNTGGGETQIINTQFINNEAPVGGGFRSDESGGQQTMINCVLVGNAAESGGGINQVGNATLNLTNCTITANNASSGGGIYKNSGIINVTNSIISLNYANQELNNVQGELATNTNNIIDYNPGFVCEPEFDSNYNLINADTIDLHLRSDSIAIDKGDNSTVENIETDIDGNARIYGETVDIGAYEYLVVPYSAVVNTLNDSFYLYDNEWSLREAIYYSTEYVTITFADDLEGTIVLSLGQLEIDKALAIDGDNRITIDADQNSRVFYVSGGTEETPVDLNGLTIQNGTEDYGAGIYVDSGNLNINSCNINNNIATKINNYGYIYGNGGGIYNSSGTLTITDSSISGNSASYKGGGVYSSSGILTIFDSVISDNTAIGTSNYSGTGNYSGYGGGIYIEGSNSTLSVTNSTISENTASDYGGGIYNSGTLTISDSEISENTASGYGGGIYNTGTLTISDSEISENTTSVSGGGIYNTGTLTITNSAISGNIASYDGGGIFNYFGTLIISDSEISENSALGTNNASNSGGGGIYNWGSNSSLSISNSTISGNSASNSGGGICAFLGTITISDSVISGNTANSTEYYSGHGGGIYNTDAEITITNSTISGNSSSYRGGGIGNGGKLTISDTVISENSAKQGGGIFNYTYSTTSISHSEILDNTATASGSYSGGGGIYNYGTLTISDSVISGNTATISGYSSGGGGIYNAKTLTITDSEISGNTATGTDNYSGSGGGIYNRSGTLSITGSEISENIVSGSYNTAGAGIYIDDGSLTISDSSISGNTATSDKYSYGGGIYNSVGTIIVSNSEISDNTANMYGGIGNLYGEITITDSEISGNTASNSVGGGIFNSTNFSSGKAGVISIINSTISGNSAPRGGGIYNQGSITISGSLISDNTAISDNYSYGGGIYNNEGTLIISDSVISDNTAISKYSYGGGIYNTGGTLSVISSVISGNTANYSGGGIYNCGSSSALTITNSTISGNTATNGGGIYKDSGTLYVYNSIVSLNYGGNVYGEQSDNSANNIIDYYPGFVCAPVFDSDGKLTNSITMDLHLRSDSIAIDKGNNSAVENINKDIEGNARIYGEIVDIGAYEYQGNRNDEPISNSTVVNTLNDSFDLDDDEWSLREAIYYAPEYVTITFADELEGIIVLTQGQLNIDKALAINGANRITIDADQKNRAFYVSSGSEEFPVVLNGLIIQNGKTAENGGGIYNNSGTLTITNSEISGNTAASYGGGIYNYSGTFTITNSIISGNTVTGANSSYGGGIYNYSGTFTITNSTISGNTVTGANSSYGGGIYNKSGTLTITNSAISGNTVTGANYSYGGGIYNSSGTLALINSVISGNTASYAGGGIYNSSGTLTITNSTISDNTATNGGGICNCGTLTISASEISGNTATYIGGGIDNFGTLTITNSTISGNTASYGGGVFNNSGTSSINNCTIKDNSATENGGGINNNADVITISNSFILDNTASYGGGIFNNSGTSSINNCTIKGNSATESGGGINNNADVITISNSFILDNTAFYGGALLNHSGVSTLTNCTIVYNTAHYGGGIYNGSSSAIHKVYNSIVVCNSAYRSSYGPDVYKYSGTVYGYNNLSSYKGWSGSDNYVYDSNSPLFKNADNGDFRLIEGSQAIDKGSNQYAYDAGMDETWKDINGADRFIGNCIDLGAYEYFNFTVSQSGIYVGDVVFSWTQYRNATKVRLTWYSGTTKTELGTFDSVGAYTWDTTAFANGYGQMTAEYLDENGSVIYSSTFTSLILNDDNVVVHRGDITESETWSADKVHLVAEQVNVLNGGAITIAQNAVVKFWKNAYLYADSGSTITVQDNVVFTRAEDDETAGDTNLDGNLTAPQFGNAYLRGNGTFNISQSVTMKYVTVTTSGTISSDQVWFSGQVYRVTGDVTIANGATLTILPGAIVKFDSGKSLIVQSGGTLNAQGTIAQPIVFTSVKDDSYGGDTNEDDGFYSPAAGDWNQIYVQGTANFDHVIVRYTGNVSGSNGAIYGASGSRVTFNNSVLEFSKYYAMSSDSGSFTVINSVLRESQTALVNMHSSGCNAQFVNCTFADSSMFLWCGWGNTSFTNCIAANITNTFVGLSNSASFQNCVFYNPKGIGPQSFNYVGSRGNVWANPLFRNASEGDYYLMAGSPCIDAGTSNGAPKIDITGAPRVSDPYTNRDGVVDIGAYEFTDNVNSTIDLEPVNVQAPESVTTGETVTVQWTIRNNGTAAAKGSWTDAVYLVNETTGQTVLVKEYVHAGSIPAGDLQTFYTDVVIPAASDGAWNVQVRVNTNRDIFEGANIGNNALLAQTATIVQTPFLTDSQGVIAARNNQPALYRFTVKAGDALCLQATSDNPVSIYMRENYAPNSSNYDFAAVEYQAGNYTLYIAPADADRTFYLLAETTSENALVEYVLQNEAALSVLSVTPQEASNMGTSTFTFTGTGFNSAMTVSLQCGNKTVVGTNLSVSSGSNATATFDLTGQQPGMYSLVVSYNGQTAASPAPITVKDGAGSVVDSWLDMPQSVRAERVYSVKLYYENKGDCDALLPIFTIQANGDVLLGWSADSVTETELYALGVGSESSAGVLKAGESGYVTFYVLAKKTTIVSSTQWNGAITDMFNSSYWTSWDEFHSDLSDAVTRLALRGNKIMSYQDAYAFLVMQKSGMESTGLSGTLRNSRSGEPISGVYLTASWDNGNRYDLAVTDENGHYAFNYLPQNAALTIEADGVYGLSQTSVYLGQTDCVDFDLTALPYSSISGRVTTESGVGLENLLVLAWTEDGNYGVAYTDYRGLYEIVGLPLGQYKVSVESAGAFNSPTVESINVLNVEGAISVDFKLSQGDGYTPQAALTNDEFASIVETFGDLTFPDAAENLNVFRLTDEEFSAVNLIRALYVASCTTDDDIILVDSSETLTLNGTPIEICIDQGQYGTVSIVGIGEDRAKIRVNPDDSTFFVSSGVLQIGSIDFVSVATDDNWMNLSSIFDTLMTINGSYIAGNVFTQYVSYFDKHGSNIYETYFKLVEDNGEYYYVEIESPVNSGTLSTTMVDDNVSVITTLEADNNDNDLFSHNYVLIFSGGRDPIYNGKYFYWEVCDLYDACINNYKIPKENIYVLYADGTDTACDRNLHNPKEDPLLENSDMDLFIGSHVYSATYENLSTVYNELNLRLTPDDHILVFIGDHGIQDENSPYTALVAGWNIDITDSSMASKTQFNAWTTYAFCHCFSGGMLDNYIISKKQYAIASSEYYRESFSDGFVMKFVSVMNDEYVNGVSKTGNEFFLSARRRNKYTDGFWDSTDYDDYLDLKDRFDTRINDDGKYEVFYIENSVGYGADFPVFTQYIKTLPAPILSLVNSTSNSITVGWTPIENTSYYTAKCINQDTGVTRTYTISSLQSKYKFSGLSSGSSYLIEIAAISNKNGYESSEWGSCLVATTAPQSCDPNEIIGPQGADFTWHDEGTEDEPFRVIDGANWITNNVGQENEYKIYFENKATAAAAAQEITVTTVLPDTMDWDSFQVDSISIGNEIFTLSDDCLIAENTWLVNQASTGEQIKIRFDFDAQTGEATWYLRSYVSSTYDNFPTSAYDGFLPPNDSNHSGEGYISYRVKYDSDLATGDVVTTNATIVFDSNEPIDTNLWLNTIDADAPVVQLEVSTVAGVGVLLEWSGSDAGSGIDQYQIYVSGDGSTYTLWNTFDADVSSVIYESKIGEYSFYILAVDAVGNVGGDPNQATPPLVVVSDMDARIVKDRTSHLSTDEISENLATITDWDDFYMEFWTANLNEIDAGEVYTALIRYDSSLFVVDAGQTIVTPDGVTAELTEMAPIADVGLSTVKVTFTVGEDGYTAPGANTYWGAVHFTPNLADDAGVQNVLEPSELNVTANGKTSGTTVKAMPYDLDHNNIVDLGDFIAFATVFGKSPDSVDASDSSYTQTQLSDYDGSGIIDIQDFIAFATNYGIKKGDAANYYKASDQGNNAAEPAAVPVNQENSIELGQHELIADEETSIQMTQPVIALQNPEIVESYVTILELSPEYLPPAQPAQAASVQMLRQAHSSALLDLYDNQIGAEPAAEFTASAIDEALYQDDEFDFLFDDSDLDADDNSDSSVDLSVVLDELELELL